MPYWTTVEGKPHLVVPYSLSTNDSKFGRGTFATGDDFFTYCRDAFDFLYREGATQPRCCPSACICGSSAIPPAPAAWSGCSIMSSRFPGVWITRRIDIARHWAATHPPA